MAAGLSIETSSEPQCCSASKAEITCPGIDLCDLVDQAAMLLRLEGGDHPVQRLVLISWWHVAAMLLRLEGGDH